MGVHDLWQVLEPVARKVHLEELKGQVIAVDLSGWIVESQRVQATHNTSKYMHLRNLFFRCSKLLGYGMDLVFVLEGNAPDVKGETLSQRSKLYYPEIRDSRRGGSRPRLRALSEQCRELLSIMGLHCVQSLGEAEATCAALNKKKLVDACMTEDSDVFLYGATLVYRGVDIDDKDPHVLAYKMSDIESQLNLTREKLIAVALLAGCDYFPGVQGVGKETAIKLFSKLGDVDILERFKSWNTDSKFEQLQNKADVIMRKPRHCNVCHHPGTPKAHTEEGCENCKTEKRCKVLSEKDARCTCRWHETDSVKREWKLELDVRKKAMATAQFPPEEVVQEFLCDQVEFHSLDGSWKQPELSPFQEFMQKMLFWEPSESHEKLFPLLTRWHLLHVDRPCRTLKAERIVKLRNIRNVPLYEVLWSQEQCEGTVPEGDASGTTTLEPQQLFRQCYPALVDQFLEEVNAKKATKKTAKNTKDIREFFKVKAKSKANKPESQSQEQVQPDLVEDTKNKTGGNCNVENEEVKEHERGELANLNKEQSQPVIAGKLKQSTETEQKAEKLTRLRQTEKKHVTRTQKPVPEPTAEITHFFGSPGKKGIGDDSLAEYTVPLAERIRRKEVHSSRKDARKIDGMSDLEISLQEPTPPELQSPTKASREEVLSGHDCSPPKRKLVSPKPSPRMDAKTESLRVEPEAQFTNLRSPNTLRNDQSTTTGKSVRCLFPVECHTAAVKDDLTSPAELENCSSQRCCSVAASSFESTPISAMRERRSRREHTPTESDYDPSKSLFSSFENQSSLNRETHSIIEISDEES
uniref:Putative flap endonuclease gen n=1 Tax=Ornithodoros turicata TaxID=34597 RepID=A0A2R5LL28_9ACAR